MSVDPKQLDKTKIIGFRVTEEELQNTIYPVMHDCHQLGIIDHDSDVVSALLRPILDGPLLNEEAAVR